METIQKMFEHLHWANERILDSLQKIEGENNGALRLFSHILLTEKLWFTRLQGLDSSHIAIWEDVHIDACAELAKQNEQSITSFLKNLTNRDLDNIVTYKNSKGIEFQNTLREILTHVALHGHYHRGQINLRLRSERHEPVNVDFITFVR
ncbi:DinB family protein [Aeribacillus composti]|uniref:DinB family protein n=1 Tax=Aeribacillus composti TaxID=1868734 RepID=UPI002E2064C7|nr:DinB family protein [Aeribacillus composti]